MRTFLVIAWTCIRLLGLGLRGVSAVRLEGSRKRKLAQPVSHHVFGHEDRVEHLAVMDVESKANEIRRDHRTARPGFDRLLGLRFLRLYDFIEQMPINERAFFDRASHISTVSLGGHHGAPE